MDKNTLIISEEVETIKPSFSVKTYYAYIITNSKEKIVNIQFVLFDDPSTYSIVKSVIEKEFLVCKLLQNKSCTLKLESPSMTYQLFKDSALLGFLTEKIWINLAVEIKLRHQKNNKLDYEKLEIKHILFSLVDMLAEAQTKGIYHGPILFSNLVRTYNFDLKLTGWGQEYHINENLKNLRELETYLPEFTKFLCPSSPTTNRYFLEYFDGLIYRKDVYSLAKIIYKLISENTLTNPYSESNARDQLAKIKEELKKRGYDDQFISIIGEMFNYIPEKRLDFIELRQRLLTLEYNKISISSEMKEKRINFINENFSN
jgi:hypothetical protein